MPRKINLNQLVMDLILLIPITTLLQQLLPAINRICLATIIVLLVILKISRTLQKKELLKIIVFIFLYGWAMFITGEIAYNFNDYFYFVFFVLYAWFVVDKHDYLLQYCKSRRKYFEKIIIVWNILVFLSLFFSSSYLEGFFVSFTGNVFRLAPSATYILALIIVLVVNNKFYIFFAILPMYSILAGGSRTYLAIGVVFLLVIIYMVVPNRKIFMFLLIPLLLIICILVINSNIMDKILETVTVTENEYYQDSMIQFTSGRSLFWIADLEAYWEGSWIKKILGYGFNFVYDVNKLAVDAEIWAHNDFINILLNFGMIGLVFYLYTFKKMFKACVSDTQFSTVIKVVLLFVWFFNASFNMFYTYVCASASYPIVIFGVNEFLNKRKLKNEEIL